MPVFLYYQLKSNGIYLSPGFLFNTNILQYFTGVIFYWIIKQVRKTCNGMYLKLKKCLFTSEGEG